MNVNAKPSQQSQTCGKTSPRKTLPHTVNSTTALNSMVGLNKKERRRYPFQGRCHSKQLFVIRFTVLVNSTADFGAVQQSNFITPGHMWMGNCKNHRRHGEKSTTITTDVRGSHSPLYTVRQAKRLQYHFARSWYDPVQVELHTNQQQSGRPKHQSKGWWFAVCLEQLCPTEIAY